VLAQAIGSLIDADLEPEHRLLLAHAVVGMAEGASRHWLDVRGEGPDEEPGTAPVDRPARSDQAEVLAARLADFAWAGLRQVHRI
jgi:hypothetical protein